MAKPLLVNSLRLLYFELHSEFGIADDEGMEMAFSVGALYLVKKAEPEPEGKLARVTEAFSNGNSNGQSNGQGLEIGSPVIIRSSRYQGKYDGKKGAISTEPSNFGLKVDIGSDTPIFFLKDEVTLLN
jgi:hypothetical protein